jgi:hypothetical protein
MDTRRKKPTVGAVGEDDTARVAPLSMHSVPHPTIRVNRQILPANDLKRTGCPARRKARRLHLPTQAAPHRGRR